MDRKPSSNVLLNWVTLMVIAVGVYYLWSQFQKTRAQNQEVMASFFERLVRADSVAGVKFTDRTALFVIRGDKSGARFVADLGGPPRETILEKLNANKVDYEFKKAAPSFWNMFLSFLPWLLLIGVWIFFFSLMFRQGNQALKFISKAKVVAKIPEEKFTDVAGCDEAKAELEEVIEFLRAPQKFERLGGKLPKGVLLVGPPGTGKTLLARAVAGEARRPFFSMSGSDFVEMFVGVGASRVRDLFEKGKKNAPCIIFIDEIDAVGRHRGAGLGGGHDEREQTLNQLLVEMDGFEARAGLIVLAATNRPDVLDEALLRPGRFDRRVVVDMPDVKGREEILKVHTRKIPLDGKVSLSRIARGTPGLSGADLANIVNEAAIFAAKENKPVVDEESFEKAMDKVMLGLERKSMVLSPEEKRITAYHEAGHTLIGVKISCLDPVCKVSIIPRGQSLGVTYSLPESDRHNYTREYLLARLAMAYGGRAAEEMIFGPDKITTGASEDIRQATETARRMITQFGMNETVGLIAVGDEGEKVFLGRQIVERPRVSEATAALIDAELKKMLSEAYQRARTILEENIEILHKLAAALIEKETLDQEDVEKITRI